MIVRYNQLNRLETPALTLCNPGSVYHNGELSNMVGVLTDHEAEEIIFNFNATSELNFRIKKTPMKMRMCNECTSLCKTEDSFLSKILVIL